MFNTVTKPSDCEQRRDARGFTLIELMVVVAIVGVLATLGLVSYRRFITSAKTSEAIGMVGSIRAAEESYRAETLSYLNVSQSQTYYPDNNVGKKKSSWDFPSHPDYVRWRQLGARSDGPVYYGYRVAAGTAGGTYPTLNCAQKPVFPAAVEPWYVIEAKGDVDGNSINSYVVGSSFTGEIYVENEGE